MAQPLDPRRIEVIDDATAAMFRLQTGSQSVQSGFAMFDFAVQVLTASVRAQHPEWSAHQVEGEVARRLHTDAA